MGDCEAAIVAGTNLILGPSMTSTMTEAGVLSPEGSCKTFDAAADGYARAEAITAVLVKPLHAAIKSKSPIRAIIRHVGTNSDGRSQGLTAPNGKAHEELMREVYQRAGLDPVETAFVEVFFFLISYCPFSWLFSFSHSWSVPWNGDSRWRSHRSWGCGKRIRKKWNLYWIGREHCYLFRFSMSIK